MTSRELQQTDPTFEPGLSLRSKRTYWGIQKEISGLARHRERAKRGLEVALSGVGEVVAAVLAQPVEGSGDVAPSKARGVKRIIIGLERTVHEVASGVAVRGEKGLRTLFGGLREEIQENREYRRRQTQQN